MERSWSAEKALKIMGNLAETFGYNDAGESLLVADANTSFIFHILPDDTGTSAIWIAQRVAANQVAVVANAFIIREVDLGGANGDFMFGDNMLAIAERLGWWKRSEPFDFCRVFSK